MSNNLVDLLTITSEELDSFRQQCLPNDDQSSRRLSTVSDDISFKRQFQIFYENKQFFDFKIMSSSDDVLCVHRIILLINGCKAIEELDKSVDTFVIKDVSKESIQTIIDYFYYQRLGSSDESIEEFVRIGDALDNEELKNKITDRHIVPPVMATIETLFDILKKAPKKKRTIDFDPNLSAKRLKTFKESALNCNVISFPQTIVDKSVGNTSAITLNAIENHSNVVSDVDDMNLEMTCSEEIIEKETNCNESVDRIDQQLTDENENNFVDNSDDAIEDNTKISMSYQLIERPKHDHNLKLTSSDVWMSLMTPTLNGKPVCVALSHRLIRWISLSDGKGLGGFEAPTQYNFRCIASTVLKRRGKSDVTIYAIGCIESYLGSGANGRIYFCRQPKDDSLRSIDCNACEHLDDLMEISDIVFHTSKPNLMFFATNDNKVMAIFLNIDHRDGRVLTKSIKTANHYKHGLRFAVISLLYIESLDVLVASGESSDIIFFHNVSDPLSINPIIGRLSLEPEIKPISSLIYIPDQKCLCVRSSSEHLLTVKMEKIMNCLKSDNSGETEVRLPPELSTPFVFIKPFEPRIEFTKMAFSSGLIACGDHFGNTYLYDTNSFDSKTIVKPNQVLKREKWFALNNDKELLIIRSVVISDDRKYIVCTTNYNTICIWKASDDKLKK